MAYPLTVFQNIIKYLKGEDNSDKDVTRCELKQYDAMSSVDCSENRRRMIEHSILERYGKYFMLKAMEK